MPPNRPLDLTRRGAKTGHSSTANHLVGTPPSRSRRSCLGPNLRLTHRNAGSQRSYPLDRQNPRSGDAKRKQGKEGGHGKSEPAVGASQLTGCGCGRDLGAALHCQRGGYDRGRVMGSGFRPGGGCFVQKDRCRLREGQRQHDRPQHHALCADAPEDRLGCD
jgi:hypothetical protein